MNLLQDKGSSAGSVLKLKTKASSFAKKRAKTKLWFSDGFHLL